MYKYVYKDCAPKGKGVGGSALSDPQKVSRIQSLYTAIPAIPDSSPFSAQTSKDGRAPKISHASAFTQTDTFLNMYSITLNILYRRRVSRIYTAMQLHTRERRAICRHRICLVSCLAPTNCKHTSLKSDTGRVFLNAPGYAEWAFVMFRQPRLHA